jgi:hypothetical protein
MANGSYLISVKRPMTLEKDTTLCHRNCGEGEPRRRHEELPCFFIREEQRRRHRGRRPEGGTGHMKGSGRRESRWGNEAGPGSA